MRKTITCDVIVATPPAPAHELATVTVEIPVETDAEQKPAPKRRPRKG